MLVAAADLCRAAVPADREALAPDQLRKVWTVPGCHCLFEAGRKSRAARWGAPRRLFTIRGAVGRIAFRPDGAAIAFENLRGDRTTGNAGGDVTLRGFDPARTYVWSFIAAYDFKSGRLDFVDPSFFEDRAPSWSASGRALTFTRHIEGQGDTQVTKPAPSPTPVAAGGASPQETLAALLAAPVAFQPSASADGRVFAYAARRGAVREIYVKTPNRSVRRLAAYGGDDGQELTQLTLSPTGDALAYVRGGDPNRSGDIPNPRSATVKPERALWLAGTDGRRPPWKIGPGSGPRFTPDGSGLVWTTAEGLLWAPVKREGGRLVGLGPSATMIGGPLSDVRFSPSGDRVAYRAGESLRVYDLVGDRTWEVDRPKDAVDFAATWSPDGRRVAFIRLSGPQPKQIRDGLLGYGGPYESKIPWAIVSADVETRTTSVLWRARPGRGSAYFPMDPDPTGVGHDGAQLFWGAGGRIVFVWEPDGWRHLYAVSDAGGEAVLLTPGDGEVETAALSLDGRSVFAATNIGDLGRRHLARVDLVSGVFEPATTGEASQWGPTPLADGALAFIDAGWADPPRVAVRRFDGSTAVAGPPAVQDGFARDLLVRPELVDVVAADGGRAYGQLFRPRRPTGCGVVFAHGGVQRQMLPGFHYMEAYSNLYEVNQYLASRGCAVLSIEYRSSVMRGYDFRNPAGWGSAGASEMSDVLGAAAALRSDPGLKVRHVGVWGLSWGGYITAQALGAHSDVFEAGFDIAGVHAFFGERAKYGPLAAAQTWRSPVFLVQGDDDRNVDFYQGLVLARALHARPDVTTVLRAVPDETHDVNLSFQHLLATYGEGADFLIDHLADAAPARPH